MKTTRILAACFATGTLLAVSAFAQSGTPVVEPPPPSPGQAPASTTKPSSGSLTDANAIGKSSGSGTVKELRFAAVDADSDGLISLSEFVTFMDAGNVQRSADSSQGGVNPTETLFRQIDRDHDNFLSEAEVTAYQDEQDRAKR